ncbi:CD44 antigen isoform X9 [Colius striatus]|uniref:CD44 antigen isoform X9 n=1 Tax=Colius striatus TaxID=57412 RepID=UPI002B1E7EC8|nr:CD44 antigen isoform X9 [Colius striatus]
MASFTLWATFGLCLLKLCLTETQFNVSCRYGGVFHVEKNGRYSLTRPEAVELCRALNSTLATLEQLRKAHDLGFETCRYGFVVGHIVIPRINPYHLCAANHTGIYKLSANTTGRYDAYCYNATETRDINCEPVERLDTSFLSNQDEIVIDNADGSRYNADGTRHGGESSTSGVDEENVGSGSQHDTTPMDASIRRSSPSYYGSVTPVSQLPDHSSGGGEKEIPRKYSDDEVSPVSPDISLVTATDDYPEKDDGQYPPSTTMVFNHGSKQNDSVQDTLMHPGWDKGDDYATQPTIMDRIIPSRENNHEKESSTTAASPDGAHGKDPTQPPLPSDHEPGEGTEGIAHPTDIPGDQVLHRTTASTRKPGGDSPQMSTITEPVGDVNGEKATEEPLAPGTGAGREREQETTTDGSHVNWIPGVFPDIEDRLNHLQTPLPTITASTDIQKAEDTTQEAWAPHGVVTTAASPDGVHGKDPTQPPLPSDREPGEGTEGIAHPTDIPGDQVLHRTTASTRKPGGDSPLMGTITEPVGDVNGEKATEEPLAPGTGAGSEREQETTTDGSHVNWIPGVFPDIEDRLNHLQTPLPTRSTSSIYGNRGPHKGHFESTTFPAEATTTKVNSEQRSAPVPEWLIIVAALVALALILAVCIAVNSRRRCGQKKKLVINNGKGAVEDRKTSGLNGDASKSQEMVHLVHKEQSNDRTGTCDEFLTVNETQNHQDLDMKSGV